MEGRSKERSIERQSIREFLERHISSNEVSFHMPGHKNGRIYEEAGYGEFLQKPAKADITEIPGADNLFAAHGIIAELEKRYAKLYGVDSSYLLVNGSTVGIMAAILATVGSGEKLIVNRASHRSVFSAIAIGGITPVFAYPEADVKNKICTVVTAKEIERCIEEAPDAKAVMITSPSYYGHVCDIEKIAEPVHDAGMLLIVDQAHGAHLALFDKEDTCRVKEPGKGESPAFHAEETSKRQCAEAEELRPLSAERAGADLVINSIHKTLAGFTQSALLNVSFDNLSEEKRQKLGQSIEKKLQQLESSSPSYLLMVSLDINEEICRKHSEYIADWKRRLEELHAFIRSEKGIEIVCGNRQDPAKINIVVFAGKERMSGAELFDALLKRGIVAELFEEDFVSLETGIGNSDEDVKRLKDALIEIRDLFQQKCLQDEKKKGQENGKAERHAKVQENCGKNSLETEPSLADLAIIGKKHEGQRQERGEAELPTERVKTEASEAHISAEDVTPYPPGIPVVTRGELITKGDIKILKAMNLEEIEVIKLSK